MYCYNNYRQNKHFTSSHRARERVLQCKGVNTVGFRKIIILRRQYWKLVVCIQIYGDGVFEGIHVNRLPELLMRDKPANVLKFSNVANAHIHMSRSRFQENSKLPESSTATYSRVMGASIHTIKSDRFEIPYVCSTFAISGSTTRGLSNRKQNNSGT